jgi:hypothetical protein
MEMTEILTALREARGQLDAVRSAMADPLSRWPAEPQRKEIVGEVAAAWSDLVSKEAAYQRLLEQTILELVDRVARLEETVAAVS